MQNKVVRFVEKSHADFLYQHVQYICQRVPKKTNDAGVLNTHELYSDSIGEAMLNYLLPKIEDVYGKKLCPTYSFWRQYYEGQDLFFHEDRPSCEVSVTLNLGGEGGHNWPIVVDDKEYPMEIGEGVIYRGEDQRHGRHPLQYKSHAQLFLHYIELEGKYYPEYKYDKRPGLYFKKNT
tara:strand:+ start:501 stop:1034 length:534 start_codon:yes stop_codon:yes gene_type:complete